MPISSLWRIISLFFIFGGMYIFDINTPYKLQILDGECFADEEEGIFCVWRVAKTDKNKIYQFIVDIFEENENGSWERDSEEHFEYAYSLEELAVMLSDAGFCDIQIYGDLSDSAPTDGEERVFITAKKGR